MKNIKCSAKCRYQGNRIDGTSFCVYWDCKDYVNETNTPDAYCITTKKLKKNFKEAKNDRDSNTQ